MITRPSLPPLEPLPIQFLEDQHKYLWTPTGQVMAFSITKVVNKKNATQLARINATKYGTEENPELGWSYRGTKLHSYAERFLLGSLTIGDVEEWALPYVKPLMASPLFANFDVVATEYRVCDLGRSIGGSFDALLQSKKTGRTLLLDFKSQTRMAAKGYDVSDQLGGYVHLLSQHHAFEVDGLAAGWLRPGKFELDILKTTPTEAVISYQVLRDMFLEANAPF